jgi:thiol:disulfide interchange protein DsbD
MTRVMTRRNALLMATVGLAVALASRAPAGEITHEGKKLLSYHLRVSPEDPFDPINDKKRDGPWKVRRSQIVRLEFAATLHDGWYTYPIAQATPQQISLTKWINEPSTGVVPLLPILESPALRYEDKQLNTSYFKYVDCFTWSQEVFISKDATPGTLQIPVLLDIQICKATCIKFKQPIKFSVEVSDEAPVEVPADLADRIAKALKPADAKAADAKPAALGGGSILSLGAIRDSHEQYKEKMELLAAKMIVKNNAAVQEADTDLLGFILAGIFWGAISLITPCVFPMIPITVSFFLKQSEKEHHRPIVMASAYSLTIVVVLTLAAAFLLSVFRWLSIHPITNYIIGALFVYFALSLFGMYEIELPNSLAKYTSEREGKGGIYGTIFMALTFTIISFACVAPFLGGFSGTAAANRPLWHNLLGGLAFSVTFASPFFFLALFPALLRKLPKSGSWLNTVKVVMGFLELAAAFKFFRTAELILTNAKPSFFTFDLVLGLWIAMSVLCGLYLVGVFRLPHDTPEEHISVPRLLFSAAFLGMALYLTPALFKLNAESQTQRPRGAVFAWIDSFLLPDSNEEETSTANLPFAVKQAREEFARTGKPKRIFIDFTGVSCTNCKINENNVFTKPQIHKLFEPYLVVKLYTDTVPAEYYSSEVRAELARDGGRVVADAEQVNLRFQKTVFNTEQLPLYVILEPQLNEDIHVLGVYKEGRIINEAAFIEFLSKPDGK